MPGSQSQLLDCHCVIEQHVNQLTLHDLVYLLSVVWLQLLSCCWHCRPEGMQRS